MLIADKIAADMEAEMRTIKLDEESKKDILDNLLKRSPNNYGKFSDSVNAILEDVKARRDEAIFEYTKKFDGADINADNIIVTKEEIEEAYKEVEKTGLVEIIRKALVNIRDYHQKQKQYSWFDSKPDGSILGQKVTPLGLSPAVLGIKNAVIYGIIQGIALAEFLAISGISSTGTPK